MCHIKVSTQTGRNKLDTSNGLVCFCFHETNCHLTTGKIVELRVRQCKFQVVTDYLNSCLPQDIRWYTPFKFSKQFSMATNTTRTNQLKKNYFACHQSYVYSDLVNINFFHVHPVSDQQITELNETTSIQDCPIFRLRLKQNLAMVDRLSRLKITFIIGSATEFNVTKYAE